MATSAELRANQDIRPAASKVRSEPASRLDVLVVDDDGGFRCALEALVLACGYECRTARNGREALEMHRRQPADVILSDLQMPITNGIELCRQVREAAAPGTYTHFILLTGHADDSYLRRALAAGADAALPKSVDPEELHTRLASIARVVACHRELSLKLAALARDSERDFQAARSDPLTHLANRLRMNEDLAVLWAHARRYGHTFSMAICDIDDFKKHNDRLGHVAGDELLRRIAATLRSELRRNDTVYRYGGDEFVVILPAQSLEQATLVMNRVREAVEHLAGVAVPAQEPATISIGVAQLDLGRDETTEDWFGRADSALYQAKKSGRNRVVAAA